MKISLAMDHGGLPLREAVLDLCRDRSLDLIDHGTDSADPVDYPDYAIRVVDDIRQGLAERGILICRTGLGMAIMANRFFGIRAAPAWNLESIRAARAHNDANVLCLGARWTDPATTRRILEIFLDMPFEGGRHDRRLSRIEILGEK